MSRPPKASDISDGCILAAVSATQGLHGVPERSSLFDIYRALDQYPRKVVLAKLKSAVRRKLIEGCCCGCRGDFELP